MAKLEKNRAQRRQEKKRSIQHRPSFWTTLQGKITAGVIGAAIVAFVVYGFWPKPEPPAAAPKPAAPAPATPPQPPPVKPHQPPAPPADPNAKLESKDVKVGTGPAAKTGDKITVHYTGTLTDGTKFDSSVGKEPLSFVLGSGRVIKGWEDGLVGMKVGGKRQLTVPPALGYGPVVHGSIPPNSILKFDVEMVKIEPQGGK